MQQKQLNTAELIDSSIVRTAIDGHKIVSSIEFNRRFRFTLSKIGDQVESILFAPEEVIVSDWNVFDECFIELPIRVNIIESIVEFVPSLKHLIFHSVMLTPDSVKSIAILTELQTLCFYKSAFDFRSETMNESEQVEFVIDTHYSDEQKTTCEHSLSSALTSLRNLRKFRITASSFYNELFSSEFIQYLPVELEVFSITFKHRQPYGFWSQIADFLRQRPNLVEILFCGQIYCEDWRKSVGNDDSRSFIAFLSETMPRLKRLQLCGHNRAVFENLDLMRNFSHLTFEFRGMTDEDFVRMCRQNSNLAFLFIICDKLSERGFIEGLPFLHRLASLGVQNSKLFNETIIQAIPASSRRSLRRVWISSLQEPSILEFFARECLSLELLQIYTKATTIENAAIVSPFTLVQFVHTVKLTRSNPYRKLRVNVRCPYLRNIDFGPLEQFDDFGKTKIVFEVQNEDGLKAKRVFGEH